MAPAAIASPLAVVLVAVVLVLLRPGCDADAAAVPFALCPFSGLAPTKPTVTFTRCTAANSASCCSDCADLRFGLQLLSANLTQVLGGLNPLVAAALSGQNVQFCPLFDSFTQCEIQLEEVTCALNCNPDSGNFVTSSAGNYTFSVCSSFADSMYTNCKGLSLPGLQITLGSVIQNSTTFFSLLFQVVSGSLGLANVTAAVIPDSSQCFAGTTDVPTTTLCCDPLAVPATCPAGAVNTTANPQFVSYINRTVNASTCTPTAPSALPSPPPPPGPAAPPSPSIAISPPPASAPASPPPAGPVTYPLCPLSQNLPAKPNVTYTRCLQANTETCCGDCKDLQYGLLAVSANLTTILSTILPNAGSILQGNDIPLCSGFVGFDQCELELEQMVCAVSCNPDGGYYLTSTNNSTNNTFYVCSAYADKVYGACKDLRLPSIQGTLGTYLPNAQLFLSVLFGGVAGVLNQINFTTQVVPGSAGCFAGPPAYPQEALCCDPLAVPSSCPAGAVNFTAYPQFTKYSNRTLDPNTCPLRTSAGSPPPNNLLLFPPPPPNPALMWRAGALQCFLTAFVAAALLLPAVRPVLLGFLRF